MEWLALVFVSLGVAIVGYSGSSGRSMATKDPTAAVFGTSLVFGAVALQAVQFVVEEHILAASSLAPMRLVYTEGFFGTTILVTALVCYTSRFWLRSPTQLSHTRRSTWSSLFTTRLRYAPWWCLFCL